MSAVLDGIRIVDLSSGIAGPAATKLLAEQGATVTVVQRPGGAPIDGMLHGNRVWRRGAARRLKAGEYRFTGAARATQIVDQLVTGNVVLRPITFREGLTLADMAAVYEQAGLGTQAAFLAAAGRASLIQAIDPKAEDLEGYLFPETYNLPRDATAATLVEQMARRFLAVYDQKLRDAARARGLTTRQAVTIASLIEMETSRAEERPLVSAVYQNRMKIGMGMQCDPTVIFALRKAGLWRGNLTRENLQFDSPYNTYRYAGLPPGPIAAPGRSSIEAVLRPAKVDYLYFVSRNDGTHVFATTLAEHNRNVRQWQKRP